jgi:hypothetical protein
VRHAELVELALGELALLAQHLELMAGDGDVPFSASARASMSRRGRGRRSPGRAPPRFVEELLGAGAGADEGRSREGRSARVAAVAWHSSPAA